MDGPTFEDHLDRARSFALSPGEVAEVAEHLRTTDDDRARFKCIMILRRQGSRAHVPLVAPLVRSTDNGVADEAMRFLVRDADRADLCRDTLLEWLGDEDEFSPRQLYAVQLAGEAYLQLHNERLLREILRLLDHEDEESTGASAADSLVIVLTPDYKRMLPRDSHLLRRGADVAAYRRRAEAMLRGDVTRG